MFCREEGCAGGCYVINKNDRASTNAGRVGARKCFMKVGDARGAFFCACLRFCFANTYEHFWCEFKNTTIIV